MKKDPRSGENYFEIAKYYFVHGLYNEAVETLNVVEVSYELLGMFGKLEKDHQLFRKTEEMQGGKPGRVQKDNESR